EGGIEEAVSQLARAECVEVVFGGEDEDADRHRAFGDARMEEDAMDTGESLDHAAAGALAGIGQDFDSGSGDAYPARRANARGEKDREKQPHNSMLPGGVSRQACAPFDKENAQAW